MVSNYMGDPRDKEDPQPTAPLPQPEPTFPDDDTNEGSTRTGFPDRPVWSDSIEERGI